MLFLLHGIRVLIDNGAGNERKIIDIHSARLSIEQRRAISNTMPQLEQSSLQPSTYLQHRHLLQTTSYNHLLRLHLLIARKRNHKQQQARNPPPPPPPRRGVEKPEGPSALQPTTENRALAGMHAFSGNDYVSSFFRKGKTQIWKKILKNPQFIQVFGNLVNFNFEDLEKFVCSLYTDTRNNHA